MSDLPRPRRRRFLADTELLAEAVEIVCAGRDTAFLRVNIEILGNRDAFLHAHVWPRYAWEPAEVVVRPVWDHPSARWDDPDTALGPQHDELRRQLATELGRLRALDGGDS